MIAQGWARKWRANGWTRNDEHALDKETYPWRQRLESHLRNIVPSRAEMPAYLKEAAGDAICRSLAETAALPSPQSFVAWLSNDAVDAIDRVTTNGPFKRIDGVEIAASKSELVVASIGAYALETAIVVDEHGEYSGNLGQDSWTGSDNLGERVADNCAGWTSPDSADDGRSGLASSVRSYWTSATPARACNALLRLYCFSNAITSFWDGFESSTSDRWSATAL